MLRKLGLLGPALAMAWAGIAIAGNVLLPSVKFNTDVAQIDLLKVGHEQFFWMGILEVVVWAIFALSLWPRRKSKVVWLLLVPVVLFAIQRLGLYPLLNERTMAKIAGETLADSPLHVIYAVLEAIKIAALLAIGVVGTLVHAPREPAPA